MAATTMTTTLGFVLPTGLSPRRGGLRVSVIRCSASPLTSSTGSTASGIVEKPWSSYDARLVLEDGSIWPAKSFGAPGTRVAELVFNTSLTGYQEILTDPSYAGQFVLMTNPQIGNTGVNLDDEESKQCFLAGLVRELENHPDFNAGKGSVLTTQRTIEMEPPRLQCLNHHILSFILFLSSQLDYTALTP
ncbi:hypothetical protein F2Q69_00051200 [Brassica cretica]|uniref:Carbamoyl-phosphate synthase small subunit N-terminal domain-containing protein n=1 Tax=Brassica cretica TaxID=69181 RepID=A0A8S9PUL4_BRACR|nr:hypothetical protein F2Q69_00051200 [Brassica cretica]